MTDEEIVQAINAWKQENNIYNIYIPSVEAYYIRARKRYQWTDDVLEQKLSELNKLKRIVVAKMKNDDKIARLLMKKDGTYEIKVSEITMEDLLYEEEGFEDFFNGMLHELTHFEKSINKSTQCNVMITSLERVNADGTISASMTEELATIINTELLQNGTVGANKFLIGYIEMQYYFNILLAAMGVSRKEFADLQELGREEYENYFIKKYGRENIMLIYSLEDMLGTIYRLEGLSQKHPNMVQVKNNIDLQSREFVSQSYNLLINRINLMKQKPKQEVSRDSIKRILGDGKIVYNNSKHIMTIPENGKEKPSLSKFFDEFISLCQEWGIKDEEVKRLRGKKIRNQKLYDWENEKIYYDTIAEIRNNGIPKTEVYESKIDEIKEKIRGLWYKIRGKNPILLTSGLQEDDVSSMKNQRNNFVHDLEYKLEDRGEYEHTEGEKTNDRTDGRDRGK